jgi:hypothetical protein
MLSFNNSLESFAHSGKRRRVKAIKADISGKRTETKKMFYKLFREQFLKEYSFWNRSYFF